MTLRELQKQVLQLSISDCWQLVQTLLASLKQETQPVQKERNLSSFRGIAKSDKILADEDTATDYAPISSISTSNASFY